MASQASGDLCDVDNVDFDRKPNEEQMMEVFECFVECRLEIDREKHIIDVSTPRIPLEDLAHTPNSRRNKYRSRLNTENPDACIRLKVTKYKPDLTKLMSQIQHQGSH